MQSLTKPMSPKKYRIGDLAKELNVKKFVIRFWEKEFDLKSDRSQGGQRFYTKEDFKTFHSIKHLLYEQGFTIAGAKIKLSEILKTNTFANITPAQKDKSESSLMHAARKDPEVIEKIVEKKVPYIPKEFLEKTEKIKLKLRALEKQL